MNFVPVAPPSRWRWRRLRRTAGAWSLLALWLAGTGWATWVWWRDNPTPTVLGGVVIGAGCALLWGGAVAYQRGRKFQLIQKEKRHAR